MLMGQQVEVAGLEQRRDQVEGVLVDEDGAEDGLLGLDVVRKVASPAERDGSVGAALRLIVGHRRSAI